MQNHRTGNERPRDLFVLLYFIFLHKVPPFVLAEHIESGEDGNHYEIVGDCKKWWKQCRTQCIFAAIFDEIPDRLQNSMLSFIVNLCQVCKVLWIVKRHRCSLLRCMYLSQSTEDGGTGVRYGF